MDKQRYQGVFSINDSEIGEGYLGQINVRDTATDKDYVFYVRGEEDTLNPEYTEDGIIGKTSIYIENYFQKLDLNKFASGEELATYIDDTKEGISIDEFLSFPDSEYVTESIIQFHHTGTTEPVPLTSPVVQNLMPTYIANREIGQLLVSAREGSLSKNETLSFAATLKDVEFYVNDHAKGMVVPELMMSTLWREDLTPTEAHTLFNMFNQLDYNSAPGLYLYNDNISKEKRNELRYEVNLTPPIAGEHGIDAYELAEVSIKDWYTDKKYNFTVWGDDDTLSPEHVNNNEIGASYIWVSVMENDRDLNAFDNLEDLKNAIDNDSLHAMDIQEFFGDKNAALLESAILNHHLTEKPYQMNVTDTDFLTKSVPYYVGHHDIAELTLKAKDNSLTKADVLSFAKVIDNDNLNFPFSELNYLEGPFTAIYKGQKVTPKEQKAFKNVFEKLDLNLKKLSNPKKREMTYER